MQNKKGIGARGAAMVYALMFFLMCALVGSIVVTAAFANTGKLRETREEQQEYLAVRSAAQLVADMMSDGVFLCDFNVKVWPMSADSNNRTYMTVGSSLNFEIRGMEFVDSDMFKDIKSMVFDSIRYQDMKIMTNVDGEDLTGKPEYYVPVETVTTFQVQMDGVEPVNVTVRLGKGNDALMIFTAYVTAVSASGNYRVTLEGKTNLNNVVPVYQDLGGDVALFINHPTLNWIDWQAQKGA